MEDIATGQDVKAACEVIHPMLEDEDPNVRMKGLLLMARRRPGVFIENVPADPVHKWFLDKMMKMIDDDPSIEVRMQCVEIFAKLPSYLRMECAVKMFGQEELDELFRKAEEPHPPEIQAIIDNATPRDFAAEKEEREEAKKALAAAMKAKTEAAKEGAGGSSGS